jgi:HAE1 family hydrophobic/amphiphilic exporter-1
MEIDKPNRYHPIRKFFVFISIITIGIIGFASIELGYLPESGQKAISIQIEYKGMFENQIERLITNPVENQIESIPGIKRISSVSEREKSIVSLFFFDTANLEQSYLRVRDAVERVYTGFPDGVQRPILTKSDMQSRPIFIIAIPYTEDISEESLRTLFENVKGTGRIEIGGAPRKEVWINFDPQLLAYTGETASSVSRSLSEWNLITSWNRSTAIPHVVDNRMKTVEEFSEIPLTHKLHLKDIASVSLRNRTHNSIALFNGEKCVLVSVSKAGDANTVDVCRRLRQATSGLPGSIPIYDYGSTIESTLTQVAWNIGIGITAVFILTILLLHRFYPALLICLNIPFSLIATMATLNICGLSLDIMTLSGMAVGSGMVIDAGIVFVEEFVRSGNIRKTTVSIRYPVIISAVSTAAVFLPLIFAPAIIQTLFVGIALSISFTLFFSLLYVFLILPDILSVRTAPAHPSTANGPRTILNHTHKLISKAPRFLQILLAGICISGFFAAAATPVIDTDLSTEKSLRFFLEFPPGTSLTAVRERSDSLVTALSTMPAIEKYSTTFKNERTEINISLDPREDPSLIRSRIRYLTSDVPDTFLYFPEDDLYSRSLMIICTGPDTSTLRKLCSSLAQDIKAGTGYSDIVFHYKNPLPAKYLTLDTDYLFLSHTKPKDVHTYIFRALSGPVSGKWYTPLLPQGYADIRMSAADSADYSAKELMSLPVPLSNGSSTPLSSIASLGMQQETGKIYHYGRQRSATISVRIPRSEVESALGSIEELTLKHSFPHGYRTIVAPYIKEKQEEKRDLIGLVILAICLVFFILVFHFESFSDAIMSVLQVPFAFSVPLIYFYLSGTPLNSAGLIGLILVAGIAVNNSILILDELSGLPKNHTNVFQALMNKSKAIIISSLTTVAGIIPLLIGRGETHNMLASLSLTIALGVGGSMFFLYLFFFSLFPIPKKKH